MTDTLFLVGLDDTDTLTSPGTNRLAKEIVDELSDRFTCEMILRHQLLDDPRVPYTSKNGSASIWLRACPHVESSPEALRDELQDRMRHGLQTRFVTGSDPGLVVTTRVPPAVVEFGKRCQREVVRQPDARELANECGLMLEGLGGTEDGVIGALAAIGLAATRSDGRIVRLGDRRDEINGPHAVTELHNRGVVVREMSNQRIVNSGTVEVGKKLRANLRDGQPTLFVESNDSEHWQALKLP
ncbi:hypothetical protein [Thalassoroseus pseudoceratinae]|uniref:hypothetical protein n=1 Tax=Thalassoroseus pseudoceratinae TaxID=2713176 RepID=UPI00141E9053|nr:hypothetical protein [Thalassoroseus pseudoceratinae]